MKPTLALSLLLLALALSRGLASDEQNHVIRANDVIDVRVFQEDDLATRVRVSKEGSVILPLIESIHLGGKTVQEATVLVRDRYKANYLVDPQVSLIVADYAKEIFTVIGQVQRPGSFDLPLSQTIDLLQAIGIAGGYTKLANPANVLIKRKTPAGDQILKLDAKKMAKDRLLESFEIRPNDVITVGETLF